MTGAGFAERTLPDVEGPILSEDDKAVATALMARYPDPRSAMVPLLYLVQSKAGWIPQQGLREVAELLGLRTAEVEAVATFYTMLKLRPTGRYVLSVCTNPSCGIRGGYALWEHAQRSLGEDAERVTEDGLFTLEEEECLGACDKAPVLTVNYLYYDRVETDAFDRLVDAIRAGRVPEASRGGVPGDLREVSRVLSGSSAPSAPEPAPAVPSPPGSSQGHAADG
jgi:NADH-quinone oxidoreductase subunit E